MVVARTITILRNQSSVVELRISKLYVSEAVSEGWREYSYHWQSKGKLIKRWDNAPHYKELPNFPHHVHEGNRILSSDDINLADVLAYIETEIKKHKL